MPADLTAQPLNLLLLGLHLSVTRKGLRRIGAELLHPFAQNILVNVQVAGRLCHRYPAFPDQLDRFSRLNFRLFIAHLRLHETPNLGVHQTGSSSDQ